MISKNDFRNSRTPEDRARVEAIKNSPEFIESQALNARILNGTASDEEMAEFEKDLEEFREWNRKFKLGEVGLE